MPSYGQTTVHPVGLSILAVLCLYVLFCEKRKIAYAFIFLACFISGMQRIVVAGIDFSFVRILTMMCYLRILLRNEAFSFKFTQLDKLYSLYAVSVVIAFTLHSGTVSAFIFRAGLFVDSFGLYLIFRVYLLDINDVEDVMELLVPISYIIFVFFLFEKLTHRNVFSIFGGVPPFTQIREGKLRVQGAYAHPILAGCFWSGIVPWIYYKMKMEKKWRYRISFFLNIVIIWLTASSTPLLGMFSGFFGIYLYRHRKNIKKIRLLFVLSIIVLHLSMKAPVWYLIARIDLAGGSTGWHRAHLIDQFVINWKQWFLIGTPDISNWNVWANDITNQYILEAVNGGILALSFWILTMDESFKIVGRNIEHEKKENLKFLYWILGVSMLVHSVNFIGISYFQHIMILYILNIAMIGSIQQIDNKKL